MSKKDCTNKPCKNVSKTGGKGEIEPALLASKNNRKKLLGIVALVILAIIGFWLMIAPPTQIVGFEPINPAQGSVAILTGMFLAGIVVLFIWATYVVQKKRNKA